MNTCSKCGEDTTFTDKVCRWCREEAGETTWDVMQRTLPPQAHTLRRIGR